MKYSYRVYDCMGHHVATVEGIIKASAVADSIGGSYEEDYPGNQEENELEYPIDDRDPTDLYNPEN